MDMRLMLPILKFVCRAIGYQLVPLSTAAYRAPFESPYNHVEVHDNDWDD